MWRKYLILITNLKVIECKIVAYQTQIEAETENDRPALIIPMKIFFANIFGLFFKCYL